MQEISLGCGLTPEQDAVMRRCMTLLREGVESIDIPNTLSAMDVWPADRTPDGAHELWPYHIVEQLALIAASNIGEPKDLNDGETKRGQHMKRAISRINALYVASFAAGDRKTALACVNHIAELQGLKQPRLVKHGGKVKHEHQLPEKQNMTRDELIAYAEKHNLPIELNHEPSFVPEQDDHMLVLDAECVKRITLENPPMEAQNG